MNIRRSVAVAILVMAFCPAAVLASTTMLIADQPSAPVTLVQTTHGVADWLTAAKFRNDSQQRITCYRIGWVYVISGKGQFHTGAVMNVPSGGKTGSVYAVPAQSVPANIHAERVVFYVAEVTFADGSHWKADKNQIRAIGMKK